EVVFLLHIDVSRSELPAALKSAARPPRGMCTPPQRPFPQHPSPSDTKRLSSSAVGSSRLIAFGSMSTASTSEKRIPCFAKFAWAFFGSQVAVMYVLYAYNRAGRQRRPSDGPTRQMSRAPLRHEGTERKARRLHLDVSH